MADLPSQPAASKQHNRGCYLPISFLWSFTEPPRRDIIAKFLSSGAHCVPPPPRLIRICTEAVSPGVHFQKLKEKPTTRISLWNYIKLSALLTSTQTQPKVPHSHNQPELTLPWTSCKGQAHPNLTCVPACAPGKPTCRLGQGIPRRPGRACTKPRHRLHVTFQQHSTTRFITFSEDHLQHQVALPTAGSRCLVQLLISYILTVWGTYCLGLF